MMTRGMEMMIQSVIKMLGLDPQRVQSAIEDIGKGVNNAAADLAKIRRQNDLIIAHLGIAEEQDDGQAEDRRQLNGGSGTAGNA